MSRNKKIIVVGGNAAGPASAAKSKRVDPNAEVFLFEKSNFISTGTCEMPYVLSGVIDDYKKILFYDEKKFKAEKDVDVFLNHLVIDINRKEKFITSKNLIDGKVDNFFFDKLILAAGSIPQKHPQLIADYSNVSTFKSINDLLKVQSFIKLAKNKIVCIIGAGYIGLELAEAFSNLKYEVYLIEKEKNVFPRADKEIQSLISELLKKNNINLCCGVQQLKLFTENNFIKSFTIEGRIIEPDFVIQALGFSPNTELAVSAKLGLGSNGGIKINNRLQTSDSNILACGDNIEVKNFITNQYNYIPLASIAHLTGHIAGENAAGGNLVFNPVVRNISVKLFNQYFVQVGLNENEVKLNRFNYKVVSAVVPNLVTVIPESQSVFGKIIYETENKKILGASFLGGKEVSGYGDLISALIKNKLPAVSINNNEFNYTPMLSPFINLLNVLGRKIN